MCLAAVYSQEAATGAKELVLDKVQVIDVSGQTITCTNLFRQSAVVRGLVKRVDLANSTVTLVLA